MPRFPLLILLFLALSLPLYAESVVLVNQVGFNPDAPKICVVLEPQAEEFTVETIDPSVEWKPVFSGKLTRHGEQWVGDFSAISTPADYRVRCGERVSYAFVVKPKPYATVERMLTEFFVWERCGSPDGWAGVCHQDPVPLHGTDRKIDASGGYHQSADLRCWNDGITQALYGYVRFAEDYEPIWENGRLDAEIRRGCDYFRKIISPEGFLYDSQFVPIGWGPRDFYDRPSAMGSHFTAVRLLARASVRFRKKNETEYAEALLKDALRVWEFTQTSDFFNTPYVEPVKDLSRGTQKADFYWQTRRGGCAMLSAQAAAAYDLFLATGEEKWREVSFASTREFLALQIKEGPAAGLFRDSMETKALAFQDCTYGHLLAGVVFLVDLLRAEPNAPDAPLWRDALARWCEIQAQAFEKDQYGGFSLYRGHEMNGHVRMGDRITDEPIPVVRLDSRAPTYSAQQALIFSAAAQILNRPEYRKIAQYRIDWLVGLNQWNASCINGVGYGHHFHKVYGQFFPSTPQIPGAIMHAMPDGEYDLPVAGMLLWALREF